MPDIDVLLEQSETFVHNQTGEYLSDLQRIILAEALMDHPKRKTYDQIATETGYSGKYVKQVVAPQLWQLLSDATGERVQKSNVRAVLIPILKVTPTLTEDKSTTEESLASKTQPQPPIPQSIEAQAAEKPVKAWTEGPGEGTNTLINKAEGSSDGQGREQAEQTINSPPVPAISSSPAPSTEASVVEAEPITSPTKGIILLVDDQPQNLALLSDMLENEGYEVRQAINGALALRVAASNPPDIILLDVNMPGMDGYEVCRQLKASPVTKAIPVIFVSALHETWDKVKAFSVGGSDYMTKPLKVMEVIARIENQLKIRRSQHQLHCLNKQLEYAQRVLADLGLLDPVPGIVNRGHFDTVLQNYWQQSLQTQQSLSLLLCHIKSSSTAEGSENDLSSGSTPSPKSSLHWPLLVQTIIGSIEHHSPIVATYEMSSMASPEQGTIAILLTRTDVTQRKAIAQALDSALQLQKKSMDLTIMFGGSSLIPNKADEWQQLAKMAEQSLERSDSLTVHTNFQAWPL